MRKLPVIVLSLSVSISGLSWSQQDDDQKLEQSSEALPSATQSTEQNTELTTEQSPEQIQVTYSYLEPASSTNSFSTLYSDTMNNLKKDLANPITFEESTAFQPVYRTLAAPSNVGDASLLGSLIYSYAANANPNQRLLSGALLISNDGNRGCLYDNRSHQAPISEQVTFLTPTSDPALLLQQESLYAEMVNGND